MMVLSELKQIAIDCKCVLYRCVHDTGMYHVLGNFHCSKWGHRRLRIVNFHRKYSLLMNFLSS